MIALVAMFAVSNAGAVPEGYAALVKRVAPSVVTVLVVEKRVGAADRAAERAERNAVADTDASGLNALIRGLLSATTQGGERDEAPLGALGSGFVIRADGLIVTNRHVIAGARAVSVRLPDGREVPAKIVGADAVTDIALLSVDAGPLLPLHLGSSAAVAVGDVVIAIGNPFGLGQSVSAGIVSARARALEDDPYVDFLQTDASINRGNSGGPLLAADGAVVGVTSVIFSPSGGSVGLGFAIPAETVAAIVQELEAHGRVERGYLGISAQPLTPVLATALHMKSPTGVLVTEVDPNSPAAGALAIGDVLLKLGAETVTFKQLSKLTARLAPDTLVTLGVLRAGSLESIALKVGRLPDPPADPALGGRRGHLDPGPRDRCRRHDAGDPQGDQGHGRAEWTDHHAITTERARRFFGAARWRSHHAPRYECALHRRRFDRRRCAERASSRSSADRTRRKRDIRRADG